MPLNNKIACSGMPKQTEVGLKFKTDNFPLDKANIEISNYRNEDISNQPESQRTKLIRISSEVCFRWLKDDNNVKDPAK